MESLLLRCKIYIFSTRKIKGKKAVIKESRGVEKLRGRPRRWMATRYRSVPPLPSPLLVPLRHGRRSIAAAAAAFVLICALLPDIRQAAESAPKVGGLLLLTHSFSSHPPLPSPSLLRLASPSPLGISPTTGVRPRPPIFI